MSFRSSALAENVDLEGPGFAAMVIRNGIVVHANGYGLADLEGRTSIDRT